MSIGFFIAFIGFLMMFISRACQAQDNTDYLFFVRSDGMGVTGCLNPNGELVQTQTITGLTAEWNHIVNVENGIFFYRNDGMGAVGQIDRDGVFRTTESITGLTANWTHIVSAGRYLLFVRADGLGAVGYLSGDGRLIQTQAINTIGTDWSHVVGTQEGIFFYRASDGLGAVGQINEAGHFTTTQALPVGELVSGWTQIINTGRNLFFYRNDGQGAVGYLNREGKFAQSHSIYSLTTDCTHIVKLKHHVLLYRASDGVAMLGQIDREGQFTVAGNYEGAFNAGYDKLVVADDLMLYHPDGLMVVKRLEHDGSFSQTQALTLTAQWTHILKVRQ
jgi:hypothetical protein